MREGVGVGTWNCGWISWDVYVVYMCVWCMLVCVGPSNRVLFFFPFFFLAFMIIRCPCFSVASVPLSLFQGVCSSIKVSEVRNAKRFLQSQNLKIEAPFDLCFSRYGFFFYNIKMDRWEFDLDMGIYMVMKWSECRLCLFEW